VSLTSAHERCAERVQALAVEAGVDVGRASDDDLRAAERLRRDVSKHDITLACQSLELGQRRRAPQRVEVDPERDPTGSPSNSARRYCSSAGQYGSRADGAVVSPDFTEQVQQAFRNLLSPLAPTGSTSAMSSSSGHT
jgi:hypothetical protein